MKNKIMQNIFKWIGIITGIIGIIMLFDGIFLIPFSQWEVTRYGVSNIGIESAAFLLMFSLISILYSRMYELKQKFRKNG